MSNKEVQDGSVEESSIKDGSVKEESTSEESSGRKLSKKEARKDFLKKGGLFLSGNKKDGKDSKKEDKGGKKAEEKGGTDQADRIDYLKKKNLYLSVKQVIKKGSTRNILDNLTKKMAEEQEIEGIENSPVWQKEKDCLLKLLHIRMLLRELVEYKQNMIRKNLGLLRPSEIKNLLSLQSENDDSERDLVAEIEELKLQIAKQIRENSQSERAYKKLEKRIELVISNASLLSHPKPRTTQVVAVTTNDDKIKPKLSNYSQLFHLLQTEPKYLGHLALLLTPEEMREFQDTLILTLFGNAYAVREEYLILQLLRTAIEASLEAVNNISRPTETDAPLQMMILSYNRRKKGLTYLTRNYSPIIMRFLKQEELDFELNPVMVYNKVVGDREVATGVKENRIPMENVKKNPPKEVTELIDKRTQQLQKICEEFLDAIVMSLNDLPYGLRLICKLMHDKALQKWENVDEKKIFKVLGYFVYYRFINLVIVTPDSLKVESVHLELDNVARKNLVVVSKVLQKVFNFTKFGEDNYEKVMNSWISGTRKRVVQYFRDLIDVKSAEEMLKVNKFNDLASRSKPFIIISYKEIALTVKLLDKHKDTLVKLKDGSDEEGGVEAKPASKKSKGGSKKDHLEEILGDIGEVPEEHLQDEKEVKLELETKWQEKAADEMQENVYAKAIELVVQLFRKLDAEILQNSSLVKIFEIASKSQNKTIAKHMKKISESLVTLKKSGLVDKSSDYKKFLKDVALEVANRSERREQQLKEIGRLEAILKSLRRHHKYLETQIAEFQSYLKAAKKIAFEKQEVKKKGLFGKKKKDMRKFSYKELSKMGVIIRSDVPSLNRGKTKFFIAPVEPGIFEVEAKITGLSVAKVKIDMEDLFEKKESSITELDLDQVVLDVNMTLFLLNNEFFAKKVKN